MIRPAAPRTTGRRVSQAVPPDDEDIPVGLLESPDQPGHLGKIGTKDVLRLIGRGARASTWHGTGPSIEWLRSSFLSHQGWLRPMPHGDGSRARGLKRAAPPR